MYALTFVLVCLFVCLFSTEGVLTKAEFENKALRHNAASHVCEREGGEVDHQDTMFEICRWRTLKPQGNTWPMRPAKGNSPGEAAELPKRS
jgi:hypothetical protein